MLQASPAASIPPAGSTLYLPAPWTMKTAPPGYRRSPGFHCPAANHDTSRPWPPSGCPAHAGKAPTENTRREVLPPPRKAGRPCTVPETDCPSQTSFPPAQIGSAAYRPAARPCASAPPPPLEAPFDAASAPGASGKPWAAQRQPHVPRNPAFQSSILLSRCGTSQRESIRASPGLPMYVCMFLLPRSCLRDGLPVPAVPSIPPA